MRHTKQEHSRNSQRCIGPDSWWVRQERGCHSSSRMSPQGPVESPVMPIPNNSATEIRTRTRARGTRE